jgi:photosystem II stability/assembly factor-like uncharacterized protein
VVWRYFDLPLPSLPAKPPPPAPQLTVAGPVWDAVLPAQGDFFVVRGVTVPPALDVMSSADRGRTWQTSLHLTGAWQPLASSFDPDGHARLVVKLVDSVARLPVVWSTPDGGRSWTRQAVLGPPVAVGGLAALVGPDQIWLLPAPQREPIAAVYVSHDGGQSWSPRRLPAGLAGIPLSMSGDATLHRLCILFPAEPASLALLCSQDEGRTWELSMRSLPDPRTAFTWSGATLANVNGGQILVLLRQSVIYGGGDLPSAVYVAAGFGSPWQRLPPDTSEAPASWTVVPMSSGELLAVSGRIALGSSDGGGHWASLDDRFPEDAVV